MEQYIQVVEEEFDSPVELPVEEDGTLLITTLSAQFPGATGLKYRNESTGNWRGVRVNEAKLQAPDNTWSDTMVFCVVYPKGHASNTEGKRKSEQAFDSSGSTAKMKRAGSEFGDVLHKTTDLVVLGLAYTAEETDLKEYFETFGTVVMTQIKRDHSTQKSKGFGFIRMTEYEAQIKILSQRHMICGRWCEIKLPNSNLHRSSADSEVLNRKIFVGRCTEEVTNEDLRDYFTKYGDVVDVYIPKPFRAFAFVTFSNPQIALSLCGQDHIIGNASVHISAADPKDNFRNKDRGDDFGRGRFRGRSPSPGRSNTMANGNGMGSSGPPGGNMGNNMGGPGGFNMNNFPMNPAMFAALATQGMFGMPGMMNNGGPMGGFNSPPNNQSSGGSGGGYSNQGSGSGYNYGGYNPGYTGGYNNQTQSSQGGGSGGQSGGSWAGNSGGASGDNSKDVKGTSGWGNSQSKPEPMNSSWN